MKKPPRDVDPNPHPDRPSQTTITTDTDSNIETAAVAAISCASFVAYVLKICSRGWGGSLPGLLGNINYNQIDTAQRIDRNYFCRDTEGTPIFSNKEFERKYRMQHSVYEMIRKCVIASDSYFKCKVEAVGIPGAAPDQNITAALRKLSLVVSANTVVEYVRFGEPTNL